MKKTVFECAIACTHEQVRLRLLEVRGGFILERHVDEDDLTLPVQVLPFVCVDDQDAFAHADPHIGRLTAAYAEIRGLVTN